MGNIINCRSWPIIVYEQFDWTVLCLSAPIDWSAYDCPSRCFCLCWDEVHRLLRGMSLADVAVVTCRGDWKVLPKAGLLSQPVEPTRATTCIGIYRFWHKKQLQFTWSPLLHSRRWTVWSRWHWLLITWIGWMLLIIPMPVWRIRCHKDACLLGRINRKIGDRRFESRSGLSTQLLMQLNAQNPSERRGQVKDGFVAAAGDKWASPAYQSWTMLMFLVLGLTARIYLLNTRNDRHLSLNDLL